MESIKYISLKEAAKLTGKSQKTMQRLVAELKADSNEALKKEETKTGRKFKYLISADYLKQRYNLDASSNKAHDQQAIGSTIGATEEASDQKTVGALIDQLKIKDQQISAMSERLKEASTANSQLVERISESNKLQASLQLQLQHLNTKLLDPKKKEATKVEELQQQLEQRGRQLDQLKAIEEQLKNRRPLYLMIILVGALLFVVALLMIDRL